MATLFPQITPNITDALPDVWYSAEVAHSADESKFYGNPGIFKLGDKYLITSDNYYAAGGGDSSVQTSDDLENWSAEQIIVTGSKNAFIHDGRLYRVGGSGTNIVINSTADGVTWTTPVVIRAGLGVYPNPIFTAEPEAYVVKSGYVALTMGVRPNGTNSRHQPIIMRGDLSKNLESADAWSFVDIEWDSDWGLPNWNSPVAFWESSLIEDFDGSIKLIPRVNWRGTNTYSTSDSVLYAPVLDYDIEANEVSFDELSAHPNNQTKSFIVYDEETRLYILAANEVDRRLVAPVFDPRYILSLYISTSAKGPWTKIKTLLRDNTYGDPLRARDEVGFQYPSMLIDGDRLLVVVRVSTGYDSSDYHDSPRLWLLVINNFRWALAPYVQEED